MEIIVNTNPGNELSTSLINKISQNTAINPIATHGLGSFFNLMKSKAADEIIAVFLISSLEELEQIEGQQIFLKTSTYLFVLAADDQTLIKKALSLYPRYIAYEQDGLDDVCLVLNKMTQKYQKVALFSAASGEQAQGIEQVNQAVVEMDKVVQRNAEESAAASEELSSQSLQMKNHVDELLATAGGNGNSASLREDSTIVTIYRTDKAPVKIKVNRKLSCKSRKEIDPTEIFPMDDAAYSVY